MMTHVQNRLCVIVALGTGAVGSWNGFRWLLNNYGYLCRVLGAGSPVRTEPQATSV
jgi:hypothetical protein